MKFLSQDWFDAVNAQVAASDGLKAASANAKFAVQQVVRGAPGGGEIHHYFRVNHGSVELGLGDIDDSDATMSADYETASALNSGELDPMAAFGAGKMLVTGNMAALMMNQGVLTQLNLAFEAVRDQTEY